MPALFWSEEAVGKRSRFSPKATRRRGAKVGPAPGRASKRTSSSQHQEQAADREPAECAAVRIEVEQHRLVRRGAAPVCREIGRKLSRTVGGLPESVRVSKNSSNGGSPSTGAGYAAGCASARARSRQRSQGPRRRSSGRPRPLRRPRPPRAVFRARVARPSAPGTGSRSRPRARSAPAARRSTPSSATRRRARARRTSARSRPARRRARGAADGRRRRAPGSAPSPGSTLPRVPV